MYNNLSNMIRENVESGKYEHADDDNGGETKRKKRISRPTNFFINESKEENTRRRNKKQRKRRRQTKRTTKTDEVDEEDDVQLFTRRKACNRNQVLYDSSSSDESGDESLLNKKRVMKLRCENFLARQMIDDDVNEEMERGNKSDSYVSVEDGGDVFNLEREMIRMEEKSDEDDNMKVTRSQLERNYLANVTKRDAEIRYNLRRDMQLVKHDPLFDQELSDDDDNGDDDGKKERNLGDIRINGSNNNVSINIVQSGSGNGNNGNNGGYPVYPYMNPMTYFRHPQPPQQQPSYWDQYEYRPRFLATVPQIQEREVNRGWVGNASISNRILERVQPFIQYSTTDDRDWIERVIMIAKDLDNGKSTISHRDWIYNQRRKFKDGLKGEVLRLFHFSNHY